MYFLCSEEVGIRVGRKCYIITFKIIYYNNNNNNTRLAEVFKFLQGRRISQAAVTMELDSRLKVKHPKV